MSFQHSHRARLRFQCFLNSLSNNSSPPDFFFNAVLNRNDITKIFCQRLIRRFEQPFLCFHQVLYSLESTPSHYEMRPLFVAPRAVQIALYDAFFAGTPPSQSISDRALIQLGAVQYWLFFIRDVVKGTLVAFFLPLISGVRHLANPSTWQYIQGSSLWFGHKSSSGALPENLSEQLFLRDIIGIAKQDSANTLKIVMMNSSNETEKTATDGLVKSTQLLKLATPFSVGNWVTLQINNIWLCIQFIFTPKKFSVLLIESFKACYSIYFLGQINPRAGFFTNSSCYGDPTQTALKCLKVPIKFVYYSMNRSAGWVLCLTTATRTRSPGSPATSLGDS